VSVQRPHRSPSASPDFLLILVALANSMRLSLKKAAHVTLSSIARQESGFGMTTRQTVNDEPRKAPHATAAEPSNEAQAEANSGASASAGLRKSNAGCSTPLRGNPRLAYDWGLLSHAADWRPNMRYSTAAAVRQERLTTQCASPARFPSPRGIPAHERRLDPPVKAGAH